MWYAVVLILVAGTQYKSVAPHPWQTKAECEQFLLTDENKNEVAVLKKYIMDQAAGAEVKFGDNICERDPLHKDGTEI